MIRTISAVMVVVVVGCGAPSSVCGEGLVELNGVCTPTSSSGVGACGTNTSMVNGECLPRLEAICAGDTRVGMNTTCVAALSCGSGTSRLGNECIAPPNPACGAGTVLIGSACTVNLGSVCSTDTTGAGGDRCVASLSCGSGTTRQGNECIGAAGGITCGPGTTLQNNSCVIAPQTGPLTTFLAATTLARAVYSPSATSYEKERRFVLSELSQGNADAWVNLGSAMIGTGRALHMSNFSLNNISTTAVYFTVEDNTVVFNGVRKCASNVTPTTYGLYSKMAVNFFSWNAGVATPVACGFQGTIRAERAQHPATSTYMTKLTMNVVLSDGSTLTDHIVWF